MESAPESRYPDAPLYLEGYHSLLVDATYPEEARHAWAEYLDVEPGGADMLVADWSQPQQLRQDLANCLYNAISDAAVTFGIDERSKTISEADAESVMIYCRGAWPEARANAEDLIEKMPELALLVNPLENTELIQQIWLHHHDRRRKLPALEQLVLLPEQSATN